MVTKRSFHFGRILLTKMDSLSRLIYPAYSLPIAPHIVKTINKLNFDFIWRNKCHYIAKQDLIRTYEDGGGNAIDFDCMNGMLKIRWLENYIQNQNSLWYYIPNQIFEKVGGISFLLKCDFDFKKLPMKLSDFHQQVLLYWKLIFKHNFTPHNTPIWNNRYILVNRKSLFIPEWFSKGVWAIAHFMDMEGNVLQHVDFCDKFQIRCTQKKFKQIVKALPISLVAIIKQDIIYSKIMPTLRQLNINGINMQNYKCNNKFIRNCLLNKLSQKRLYSQRL